MEREHEIRQTAGYSIDDSTQKGIRMLKNDEVVKYEEQNWECTHLKKIQT